MNLVQNMKEIHFFIAGAAKSGISAAKILKKNGAHVFITEENKISDNLKIELDNLKIPYEENGHSFEKLKSQCDILILSPGIPLNKDISIFCKKNSIPIVSEIEFASWFMNSKSISVGITGTNGKSTTVNYLSQLFSNTKYHSKACGNIGISVSQTLLEHPNTNLFSIEFSSYQLETTYSIRPMCTSLLNLQNDHLGRYGNMDEYLKAKWRLVLLTDDLGITIIDKNIMNHVIKLGLSLPKSRIILIDEVKNTIENKNKVNEKKYTDFIYNKIENGKALPYAIYQELNDLNFDEVTLPSQFEYAYAKYNDNGSININLNLKNSTKNWIIENPCLPGKHNMMNILCASIIANFLGVPDIHILKQWEEKSSSYKHLPHRLEKISLKKNLYLDNNLKTKNILIINDSKATNVESTLVALNSFQNPIRLLIGGEPKGDDYSPIGELINNNLIKIYPFGKASNIIQEHLKNYNNKIAGSSPNMLAAANLALNDATDNEIILLSPACSSFDEFKNFEHRGDVFREWALSHLKDN